MSNEAQPLGVLRRVMEDVYPPVYCRLRPFKPAQALIEAPVADVTINGKDFPIYGATEAQIETIKSDLKLDKLDGRSIVNEHPAHARRIASMALGGAMTEEDLEAFPFRYRVIIAEICLVFLWLGPLTRTEFESMHPSAKGTRTSKTSEKKESASKVAS